MLTEINKSLKLLLSYNNQQVKTKFLLQALLILVQLLPIIFFHHDTRKLDETCETVISLIGSQEHGNVIHRIREIMRWSLQLP